jgi:diguanylate cyclase (GGDEF)-like protein
MQGKVLVVEDDPAIRQLLQAVLVGAGHTVFEAADGHSALPAAHDTQPDVVLLDVGLPGIDGFEVLARLKADDGLRRVPVIMVTAWAEPVLVAKALDRGAHDFVRKPFDVDELTKRVEAAVALGQDPDFLADGAPVHDALTALPGRRHFEEMLERQAQASRQIGQTFSVLRVDVDDLARVNDLYSREIGDDALRAVGKRLRRQARGSDVVARWEGSTFMILAPGTDLKAADVVARRLRDAIAGSPLDTPQAAVRLTVTIEAAEYEGAEHADELLARLGAATPVLA